MRNGQRRWRTTTTLARRIRRPKISIASSAGLTHCLRGQPMLRPSSQLGNPGRRPEVCDRRSVSSTSPTGTDDPSIGEVALTLVTPDGLTLDGRANEPRRPSPLAAAVLVHGINTDLDEGGMYARLADRLADDGIGVLRFSFRGHGRSAGSARGVTIAGEMLDLEAAIAEARNRWRGVPLVLVASSMGAIAALETAHFTRPDFLVLWNPVLDLRRTFVEPELPWGQQNFHAGAWTAAERDGFLLLDGEFQLGRSSWTNCTATGRWRRSSPRPRRHWSCTAVRTPTSPTTSPGRRRPSWDAHFTPSTARSTDSTLASTRARPSTSRPHGCVAGSRRSALGDGAVEAVRPGHQGRERRRRRTCRARMPLVSPGRSTAGGSGQVRGFNR
jgi:pimeloyl-ACP methyl ester carboxylesterase